MAKCLDSFNFVYIFNILNISVILRPFCGHFATILPFSAIFLSDALYFTRFPHYFPFQDDLDSISNVGRPSNGNSMYGTVSMPLGSGSAVIETLQSSLKQRDGENHQLQWELSRLQCERNMLLSEVSQLTAQLEGVSSSFGNRFFMLIHLTLLWRTQFEFLFAGER